MSDESRHFQQDTLDDDHFGRKPPMVWRFKTSGNSRGRPRGHEEQGTIVRQVAQEIHAVIEDGQQTLRSTLELEHLVQGPTSFQNLRRMWSSQSGIRYQRNSGHPVQTVDERVYQFGDLSSSSELLSTSSPVHEHENPSSDHGGSHCHYGDRT